MNQILVIAWRETSRVRNRFGSGASPLVTLALIAALGAASYYLRDFVSLGSGLYRIGVSGDVPEIQDSRFAVMDVQPEEGQTLLAQKKIDALIVDSNVYLREDDKSQFAARALRLYMEEAELIRVGNSFAPDDAFPLRAKINYLAEENAEGQNGTDAGGKPVNADGSLPTVKPEEAIIPSLTPPPAPFTQVLVALIYILPITFVSIFFTGSFMDEKMNRRLIILLSAPVTPFQIVLGKMLPYTLFAFASTTLIAALTGANIFMALAIFIPTTLFIFAIYLMVPLFYRTFKDTTFIAMLVTTLTTGYLVVPAMFANVNDFAYISPLTLAVKMYRDEPFGWREYLFPSLPMAAIFGFAMFAATRLLNEEFLMGYKPIWRKIMDAIYLMMAHSKPYIATPLWSFITIPIIYMGQIVFLAFASNLPFGLIIVAVLFASAMAEEIVKSVGIVVLAERGVVKSARQVIGLSFLSALGFLIGEKLLVLVSISAVSEASTSGAFFEAGWLLLVPLLAHFFFTTVTTLLKIKGRIYYPISIFIATILHFFYNWQIIQGAL